MPVALRPPTVLWDNFDRLSVVSITAEVSVDDAGSSSSGSQSVTPQPASPAKAAEPGMSIITTPRLRHHSLTISSVHSSGNNPETESIRSRKVREVRSDSDLRLPWLWVEGWRSRLRRAGDEVEKVRWEGKMEWRVKVVEG